MDESQTFELFCTTQQKRVRVVVKVGDSFMRGWKYRVLEVSALGDIYAIDEWGNTQNFSIYDELLYLNFEYSFIEAKFEIEEVEYRVFDQNTDESSDIIVYRVLYDGVPDVRYYENLADAQALIERSRPHGKIVL